MKLVDGIARIDDLDAFLGDLDEVAEEYDCTVQAFDARYIVSEEHLRQARRLADRAFARDENVARDRGIEIMLYAAGRRQINRALEIGVDEGEYPAVVLVDSQEGDEQAETAAADAVESLLADPGADVLGDYDIERVTEFYDITDAERDAVAGDLADLVLERVALLDVEK